MASNEILPIVVFSLFFGVALTAIGPSGATILRGIDGLVHVMLKITDYVMRFAPFAVFASVAGAVAKGGPAIIATYGKLVAGFYLGLLILWVILIAAARIIIGPAVLDLLRCISNPVALAFSTASSEAAYPRTLEELEAFGVPPRVASFVLPWAIHSISTAR